MKNPIKGNRIVSDETFATRLKSFLEDVKPNCAAGQEELDYLSSVAEELLDYQVSTCPEDEKGYHLNINPEILPKLGKYLSNSQKIIYTFQAEDISDALRQAIHLNNSESKTTCFDRSVVKAKKLIDNVINGHPEKFVPRS